MKAIYQRPAILQNLNVSTT